MRGPFAVDEVVFSGRGVHLQGRLRIMEVDAIELSSMPTHVGKLRALQVVEEWRNQLPSLPSSAALSSALARFTPRP